MAEVKWIKIMTDMFDNRKIKQIETLPEGDAIIVIWVKLLCLAGNINDKGMIYLTSEIPYTEQMLSIQFNRPFPVIQLALRTFQNFKMIDIIDDILQISSWEKYQNVEGMEKKMCIRDSPGGTDSSGTRTFRRAWGRGADGGCHRNRGQ